MKLNRLLEESSRTFQRFPLALLSAAVGTIAAICLTERSSSQDNGVFNNLFITAALGLPLFTVIPIFAEKRQWSRAWHLLTQLTGAALLIIYFVMLPEDVFSAPNRHTIHFFLLSIALHFLVAFAPYASRGEINGFWQFNKTLFLRFLTAVFYSGVLYLGLVIAMAAVDHLFELKIDGKRYGQLWLLIAGIFNTWFFLAGVPEDFNALDRDTLYPRGLKIFTQYILMPLVVIYLIILYAYEATIIINWAWPKGWVANLVLGFSVTGILALLLVHPIQERQENRWIKIFARWYYRAQVPLVIMLLLAIWRRISEYGVTENRYFVLVMGASLAAIVLYFIFSKQKNIKIIPLTLCSLAFLSAFGPWSAFAVSARSQMHRLETLLLKNNILIEGFVQKSSQPPRFADTKEISSIVQYLCDTHGPEILQPWFKQDLQQALQDSGETEVKIYGNRTATRMVGLMGLAFVSQWETAVGRHFSFNSKREGVYALVGYDYLLQSNELNYSSNTETFSAGASTYTLVFDHERSLLTLKGNGEEELLLSIELTPLVRRLLAEYATSQFSGFPPSEKMTIAASNQLLKTKFCFLSLQGQREGGALKIFSLKVDVFIGKLSTILQIEQ